MKLSPHFTLEEMTKTNFPALQDEPTVQEVVNLTYLCATVLEPLREKVGKPLKINSGFRSKRLNAKVGGVANSYHLRGLAADIHCSSFDEAKRLEQVAVNLFGKRAKAIIEHRNTYWLHIQTKLG